MVESKRSFRPLGAGNDYPHLLRFLDNREKLVKVHAADAGQKLKAETATDYRCCRQYPPLTFIEPFQTATDDQAHIFRNVGLVDRDLRAQLARCVKDLSVFDQVPIDLLDKEG